MVLLFGIARLMYLPSEKCCVLPVSRLAASIACLSANNTEQLIVRGGSPTAAKIQIPCMNFKVIIKVITHEL